MVRRSDKGSKHHHHIICNDCGEIKPLVAEKQ
ncbi:MAG: transcriptional repressor [Oribacterium sp.]|nr:transcriptional repressor [Oribacterium sp.]